MPIHPTAIIDPAAEIETSADIGPYCIVGAEVHIGARTRLMANNYLEGPTRVGEDNIFFPYSTAGVASQDLKYKGERAETRIGHRNRIREFVTIHRGTQGGGLVTAIGSDNLLMAYSHVAHDCHVGNGVVMANAATLAGHVRVEDHAILGGLCAVLQFTRIGAHVMVGGATSITQDIPPYTIVTGDRREARLRGLNLVGLKRHNFSDATISGLKKAYKILSLSGMKLAEAIERMKLEIPPCDEVNHFIAFIEASKRGVCR